MSKTIKEERLKWILPIFKKIDPINTKLHIFNEFCGENNIVHYLIDKGKPTQNKTAEKSHRSDQSRIYSKEILIF